MSAQRKQLGTTLAIFALFTLGACGGGGTKATSRILLSPGDRIDPAVNAGAYGSTTGGTPLANTPTFQYQFIYYDASTDQSTMWWFRLPSNYVSGGTIVLSWFVAAGPTGNIVWKAGAVPLITGTTALDVVTFNAADSSGAVAVPGTNNVIKETRIALTMTAAAAGEFLSIFVGRDATNAADTYTGAGAVVALTFEYTST